MRLTFARLALAAASFTLAGCMQIEYGITVAEDGSGSIDASINIDVQRFAEIQSMFEGMEGESSTPPASPTELCTAALADSDTSDLPPNAIVQEINDGTRCALEVSIPWAAGELDAALQNNLDGDVTLTRTENGGWSFQLDGGAFSESVTGDATGGEEMPPELAKMFFDGVKMTIAVDLPGTVVEHNGTESGGVVSWSFNPMEAPTDSLRVRTEPTATPSPLPVLPIAGGVGVLTLVGAGLWLRRRSKAAPAPRLNGFDSTGRIEPYEVNAPEPTYPEGWYPDAYGVARLRWWDGSAWTEHTAD